MHFLYLGGFIDANADILPGIKGWIRPREHSTIWFQARAVYNMEDVPFMLKVHLLNTEVVETLLYLCVAWVLGLEHLAKL